MSSWYWRWRKDAASGAVPKEEGAEREARLRQIASLFHAIGDSDSETCNERSETATWH